MKFYVLKNPVDSYDVAVTDFLKADTVNRGEAPRCPLCGDLIGLLPWLPPYRAELEFWTKLAGDIAFGPGDELLVSQHFVELYKNSDLTGLSGFYPVEIVKTIFRGGKVKHIPNYYCVRITTSRAVVNHKASGLELEEPWTCKECRTGLIKRTKRVVLEEGSWSGEDIFCPRGLSGTIITSQNFKDFFVQNNINSGLLIEADKYSFDFYPNEHLQKQHV